MLHIPFASRPVRFVRHTLIVAALLTPLGCPPPVHTTPPPAASSAKVVALAGASIMIGAGDIAGCGSRASEGTAMVVDSVLRADSVAKVEDAVFTLGDNAYMLGSTADFTNCFAPTWGDTKKRIMKRIHPAPGNHDYYTAGAGPYYRFFGAASGPPGKGYYSYDVGKWHVISLNSEILMTGTWTSAERQAQVDWLAKDLKDHPTLCTLAYWHHPLFSSGWHGSDRRLAPIWRLLYDNGVDLVLNGHDHDYERFLPQTPDGIADSTRGITEIIAGTGGESLRGFEATIVRNSAARIQGHTGVLLLALGGGEYRSAFLEANGTVWDPSGGKCH